MQPICYAPTQQSHSQIFSPVVNLPLPHQVHHACKHPTSQNHRHPILHRPLSPSHFASSPSAKHYRVLCPDRRAFAQPVCTAKRFRTGRGGSPHLRYHQKTPPRSSTLGVPTKAAAVYCGFRTGASASLLSLHLSSPTLNSHRASVTWEMGVAGGITRSESLRLTNAYACANTSASAALPIGQRNPLGPLALSQAAIDTTPKNRAE